MKKLIYLLFWVICTALYAQDKKERKVFWVHGLGDNANFWSKQYADAQKNYCVRSYGFTYPTNAGIQRYADSIRMGSNAIRGSQTIAVGHSMGGVAIREANRDDNGLYGGMITLGAPLDGAKIANESISGGTLRFIQQSTDNLRRGPIASASRTKWQKLTQTIGAILRGNVLSGIIRAFGGPIARILQNLGVDFQQAVISNFDPKDPSVRDLAENSAYLRSIRSFQSTQPKILAWGDEYSPVHARLFISTTTLIPNNAANLLSAYNLAGNLYKMTADGIRVGGFLCFRGCRNRKRSEKEAWNAGADYIKRSWEIAWNELTGARYLESYTTTERNYECGSSGGILDVRNIDPADRMCFFASDCNACGWQTRTITRKRWVNTPSDGLVKKSSQIGENSSWGGKPVRLPGVNHAEMGVHEEVDKLFRDAFKGDHNQFFKTAKR